MAGERTPWDTGRKRHGGDLQRGAGLHCGRRCGRRGDRLRETLLQSTEWVIACVCMSRGKHRSNVVADGLWRHHNKVAKYINSSINSGFVFISSVGSAQKAHPHRAPIPVLKLHVTWNSDICTLFTFTQNVYSQFPPIPTLFTSTYHSNSCISFQLLFFFRVCSL